MSCWTNKFSSWLIDLFLVSGMKTREKKAPRILKMLAMKKIPLRSKISIR